MKKYGLTALMQLAKGLSKKTHDTFALNLTALKETVKWAWRAMLDDFPFEMRLVKAAINVRRGRRNKNGPAILRELRARDCPVVVVNQDFYNGFPKLSGAEYNAILCSARACFIRIKPDDARAILEWHDFETIPFDWHGTVAVPRQDDRIAPLRATYILGRLCKDGWRLLTVNDAAAILDGLKVANVDHLFLTKKGHWLTPVAEIAYFAKISSSLFAMCERVVSTGMPTIIVYTPGLPRPFRLWRLSLRKIMAPAPVIG